MKFKAQDLRDMVWDDSDELTLISDTIEGTSRWNTENRVVFEYNGKYYASHYRGSVGDGEPVMWDYEDEVECVEVVPVEEPVIVYKSVNKT